MANSDAASSNDDCMLLAIPGELRNIIYKHYLQVEGGYVYDFESGKLSCATPPGARSPIDLELMLSCRQIAAEMQGLALKSNTITFRPVAPAAKQDNLHYLSTYQRKRWDDLFKFLQEKDFNHPLRQSDRDWWPIPNFDESVCRMVAETFPKFEPHLRIMQRLASDSSYHAEIYDAIRFEEFTLHIGDCQNTWGEVPSLQRQAALETLKLISSRGCWSEKAWSDVDEARRLWPGGDYRVPTTDRAADLIRYHSLYKPWTIVEDDATHDIKHDKRHPAHYRSAHHSQEEYDRITLKYSMPDRGKHFLSAASIAIHFLESIPGQRGNIRNIILDETVAGNIAPECHGLGLIDFCKENPHLRVERRANMWTNVWQTAGSTCNHEGISEWVVTDSVAYWIVEALALVPAGMPPGSFTLVLDGNPAPEQCAQIFKRIQRDAAWQTALFDRGILPELKPYEDKRMMEGYSYEDFPQALRDISRGTCRAVRANFDVGEPDDVEAIIKAHREWKVADWEREWDLDVFYQTAPPLPEWKDLVEELNLPDSWHQFPSELPRSVS